MNDPARPPFTLAPRTWYGWIMFPGYGVSPYASPIWVREVEPLKSGKGVLRLSFINAAYPAGVQSFVSNLEVLQRTSDFLYARLIDYPDRGAAISRMSYEWLRHYCPQALRMDRIGEPGGDMQQFLTSAWLGPNP